MWFGRVLGMALLLGVAAAPAVADDQSSAEKLPPLDDATRTRWMAHIVKGVVGLAARGDANDAHYRYCVAGLTEQASRDVAEAVAKLHSASDSKRSPYTLSFLANPDYRPSSYPYECTGGYFLMGSIGTEPQKTIDLHRRKQWLAVSDLASPQMRPASATALQYLLMAKPNPKMTEEEKSNWDQGYIGGMSLASYLEAGPKIDPRECPSGTRPITMYTELLRKRGIALLSEKFILRYATACLSVDDDTLHIALTQKMPYLN